VIETPMSHTMVQQLATLLVLLLVVVVCRHLHRRYRVNGTLARLQAELQRLPVYSAETLCHKEAEFIHDRLPTRFPTALVIALLVLLAAAAWWLARTP
jgi:hypothetical protein